jgi:hypothetical protein
MTIRADILAIVSESAPDLRAVQVADLVMDYFRGLGVRPETRAERTVKYSIVLAVAKRKSAWTPDQIARNIIRLYHDVGLIDVRSGILDDDGQMLEDLAETWDIPA